MNNTVFLLHSGMVFVIHVLLHCKPHLRHCTVFSNSSYSPLSHASYLSRLNSASVSALSLSPPSPLIVTRKIFVFLLFSFNLHDPWAALNPISPFVSFSCLLPSLHESACRLPCYPISPHIHGVPERMRFVPPRLAITH